MKQTHLLNRPLRVRELTGLYRSPNWDRIRQPDGFVRWSIYKRVNGKLLSISFQCDWDIDRRYIASALRRVRAQMRKAIKEAQNETV